MSRGGAGPSNPLLVLIRDINARRVSLFTATRSSSTHPCPRTLLPLSSGGSTNSSLYASPSLPPLGPPRGLDISTARQRSLHTSAAASTPAGRPPKTSLPPKDLDSFFGISELKLNRLWALVSGVDPHRSFANKEAWARFGRMARDVHRALGFSLRQPYTEHDGPKLEEARAELRRRVEATPELAWRRGLARDDILEYKLAVTHHNMRNYWRRQAGLTTAEWVGFDRIGHRRAGWAEGDARNLGRPVNELLQRRRREEEARREEAGGEALDVDEENEVEGEGAAAEREKKAEEEAMTLASRPRIWRNPANAGAHFFDARLEEQGEERRRREDRIRRRRQGRAAVKEEVREIDGGDDDGSAASALPAKEQTVP